MLVERQEVGEKISQRSINEDLLGVSAPSSYAPPPLLVSTSLFRFKSALFVPTSPFHSNHPFLFQNLTFLSLSTHPFVL